MVKRRGREQAASGSGVTVLSATRARVTARSASPPPPSKRWPGAARPSPREVAADLVVGYVGGGGSGGGKA